MCMNWNRLFSPFSCTHCWALEHRIISHNSFIHLVVCLTTGPKPLPKRALHIVRSRASSFKWEYPLLSLRSSSSYLLLLPCLPVTFINRAASYFEANSRFSTVLFPLSVAVMTRDQVWSYRYNSVFISQEFVSLFLQVGALNRPNIRQKYGMNIKLSLCTSSHKFYVRLFRI